MRSALLLFLLLALGGCASAYQDVAIGEPASAHVTILAGLHTDAVETHTPFVGSFEATSTSAQDGYHLRFDLDATAAQRVGASGPIAIYGLLCVGSPTAASQSQTLRLAMPLEKLQALVRGERSEVETFIADPNTMPPRELARLLLRMSAY